MSWMLKLYALALNLYPRPFRERFAPEMEDVFQAGLEEAHGQGAVLRFGLREIFHLPGSLVDVYMWSVQTGGGRKMAISSTGGGGTFGDSLPGDTWGTSLLAGLPHLIIGMLMASSILLSGLPGSDRILWNYLLIGGMAGLLLAVVGYGFTRGWRRWSTPWLVFLFIFTVAGLSALVNDLPSRFTGGDQVQYVVQVLAILLLLAYLSYKIAAQDRLLGLLAAMPPMAYVWAFYFEEFVPALPKALAWIWLSLLACGASVLILRSRRFSTALWLAMLVPLLGGLPFAYLGVYMGGTLPNSQPGPSLLEVIRQYLPFLAGAWTVVLGPQLAVKLRAIGRKSRAAGGGLFYRLALGGILLGLAVVLLHFIDATGEPPRWVSGLVANEALTLGLPAVLYLAGLFGLVRATLGRATLRRGASTPDVSGARQLAVLFVLLPGVPLVLYMAVFTSSMFTRDPYNWLLPAAALAWAMLAARAAARTAARAAAWAVIDQRKNEL